MIWAVAYALLAGAFVVRVRTTDDPLPEPAHPLPDDPVWLLRLHHGLLLAILLGAPLERLLVAGADTGRLLGVALFATGVVLYRVAGRDLGDALSPFTEPREGVGLVTAGLYGYLRHPMYLSQALVALGAPLTLGSRHVLLLAVPTALVLFVRVLREEEALARTFPEYARYAARTKRLVPFLY
jgi:protein-S-isoprenylcysteine O-methyltransferase Ste14